MTPARLYYNCQRPDLVLTEMVIRPGYSFRSGVSMTEWAELGSHGPFKMAFKRAPWFAQFAPVEYGPTAEGKKNPIFAGEREWYSPQVVRFSSEDIEWIAFMENAPCVLGPRVLKRTKAFLAEQWGSPYIGAITIVDSYLQSCHAAN